MSVIGQRVLRKEDGRFLRGEGSYVDNVPIENALRMTFLRSPMAHARITSIDASEATALPGVQVLTGADIDIEKMPLPPFIAIDSAYWRPLVARDTVRFVGDIVAVILSEDRASGEDAAELVIVDYEPLPVVVDALEAAKDEVLLFPEAGTNLAIDLALQEPDPELFSGCEVVVSGTLRSQRMAACPLEPRSSAAIFEDGKLTCWLSTQTPHQDRDGLAGILGLEQAAVRVIAPDVGGGFGAKNLCVEDVILGWCARRVGRPVRWTESRSENMIAMNHGRSQINRFTIGADGDGKVSALRARDPPGRGRLSRLRRAPAAPHGADGERRVRDPDDRDAHPRRGDEHHADCGLPRRRAPGGHADDRARDGPAGRKGGDRPRGGAPAQLHRPRRLPLHDGLGRDV